MLRYIEKIPERAQGLFQSWTFTIALIYYERKKTQQLTSLTITETPFSL